MSRRRSYLRADDELMTADVDDFDDFEAWMDALEDRVKTAAPRRVLITDDPEPTYGTAT
jgi:hypothetical protein